MITKLDAKTLEECEYRIRAILGLMGHDPDRYDTAEAARVGYVKRGDSYLMDWDAMWESLDATAR